MKPRTDLTPAELKTTCVCGEDIEQHTGELLICPDGIYEFQSLQDEMDAERIGDRLN